MKSKGFGKTRQPTFWIQIVYPGDRHRNIPVYCNIENAMKQARDVVEKSRSPIDQVLLIEGSADPDFPGANDIRADFRTRPFTACGEVARKAS